MTAPTVHRASLTGAPVCGATGPVSTSGVAVTCPSCRDRTAPAARAAAWAAIEEAARRARQEPTS